MRTLKNICLSPTERGKNFPYTIMLLSPNDPRFFVVLLLCLPIAEAVNLFTYEQGPQEERKIVLSLRPVLFITVGDDDSWCSTITVYMQSAFRFQIYSHRYMKLERHGKVSNYPNQ